MIFTQGPKFRMSLILLFEEREGRERGEGGRGEGLVPDGNYVLKGNFRENIQKSI